VSAVIGGGSGAERRWAEPIDPAGGVSCRDPRTGGPLFVGTAAARRLAILRCSKVVFCLRRVDSSDGEKGGPNYSV
jgi:hypothetical protein